MRIRLSFIFLLILVLLITLIFYKSLFEEKNYIPKNINNKIENILIKEFNTDNNFLLKNLFDEKEELMAINIWASWCLPCRDEHSLLINLNNYDQLEIIGLNYKDDLSNAKKFINELGNPYRKILLDRDGTKAIEWGAFGVPETFLIYKGKIIKKFILCHHK